MAVVATGTPAGICTIESSESSPFRARDFTGMPTTARTGDNHRDTAAFGRLGIFAQQVRGTVGAHHTLFEIDTELSEHGNGIGHHLIIAHRAHNNTDLHTFGFKFEKKTDRHDTYVMAVWYLSAYSAPGHLLPLHLRTPILLSARRRIKRSGLALLFLTFALVDSVGRCHGEVFGLT